MQDEACHVSLHEALPWRPEHRVLPHLPEGLATERPAEPCLLCRHRLHLGAARFLVSAGDHGPGDRPRPGLAAVEHAGRGSFLAEAL